MTQTGGKAVLTSTVVGHVLTALLHERPVHLGRLAEASGTSAVPTAKDWLQIEEAVRLNSINVMEPQYDMQSIIAKMGHNDLLRKPAESRSEAEKELLTSL